MESGLGVSVFVCISFRFRQMKSRGVETIEDWFASIIYGVCVCFMYDPEIVVEKRLPEMR